MKIPIEHLAQVSRQTLEAIRQFDTCTVANAIERFDVRLRNEGFTRPGLRVITGGFPRLIGYAATVLREMEFPVFAPTVTVSHSYSHIVDFGRPVEILGLCLRPGDLLYADCHGVLSVPLSIASRIPEAATEIRANDQRIIDVCQSPDFSPEKLFKSITNTR